MRQAGHFFSAVASHSAWPCLFRYSYPKDACPAYTSVRSRVRRIAHGDPSIHHRNAQTRKSDSRSELGSFDCCPACACASCWRCRAELSPDGALPGCPAACPLGPEFCDMFQDSRSYLGQTVSGAIVIDVDWCVLGASGRTWAVAANVSVRKRSSRLTLFIRSRNSDMP